MIKVGDKSFDTKTFLSDGLIAFLTSVSTQFGEQEKINEDLQRQLKEQMEIVNDLRQKQNDQSQTIEDMQKESNEKFDDVHNKMNELELKNEKLMKSISDFEESSNQMMEKLNALSFKEEPDINASEESTKQTDNRIDEIENNLEKMQKEIELKKASNEEMSAKLQKLKNKVSAQNNAIVQLRGAIVASQKVETNDGTQPSDDDKAQNMELQMDAFKDMMIEPFDDSKLETKIIEIEEHINENDERQNEKFRVIDSGMSSLVDTVSRLDVARKKMLNNMSILNDQMKKLKQNEPIANELSFSDRDIDDESERIFANVSQSLADFSNGLVIEQLNEKYESLSTQFEINRTSTNAQYEAIKVSNEDLEYQCKSLQEAIRRNEQNLLLRTQSKASSKFASRKCSSQSSFEIVKSEKPLQNVVAKREPDNGAFLAMFNEWNRKIQSQFEEYTQMLKKKTVDKEIQINLEKMEKKLEVNIQNILFALSTKTDVNEFEETMQKLVNQINERLTNVTQPNADDALSDVISKVTPSTESLPKIEQQIKQITPPSPPPQKITVSMIKKPVINNCAMLNKLSKKADVEQLYALQQQIFDIQGAIKKMNIDRSHLSNSMSQNSRTIRQLKDGKNKVKEHEIAMSQVSICGPPQLDNTKKQENTQISADSLNGILNSHKRWIRQNADHISAVSMSMMQAKDLISKLRNDAKVKTSMTSPSRRLLKSRGCAIRNDKDELPLLLDCIALELQNKANKNELKKKLNRCELHKLKQNVDEDVVDNAYLSGRQFWKCVSCNRRTTHLKKEKECSYQLPMLSISTRARVQFNKTPPPLQSRQRGTNVDRLQRLNASMQALDKQKRPQTTPFVEKVKKVQENSMISIKW